MKKILSLLTLFVLLMTGCYNKEQESCGLAEIKLKSSVINVASRAPSEDIPTGARVLATLTDGDYNTLYANGTMSFASGGSTAVGFDGTPVYYPVEDLVYMSALNPAFSWTYDGSLAKHDYDGKGDLMCAVQQSSSNAQAHAGNYPTMAFKHILTLLNINVKATAEAATMWGTISSITLTSVMAQSPKTGIQVDMVTGVCSADVSTADVVQNFYQVTDAGQTYTNTRLIGTAIAIPASATLIGYTMCEPVIADASTAEYTLLIKTSNVPDGVSIPINLKQLSDTSIDYVGTTQGYSFNIVLNFVDEQIRALATVEPWENNGGYESDVPIPTVP